ncbi:PrsW family intramembrane metalloprotease [Agromyces sp. LHK192]|uniref:PrsW family intramembrane metalloprotease n=1 Tax=Agromyces sp. LHK192 TaxID=2498704 RepID=UPI000FDA70BE|nr:PrsW family intramembrane metalloprotease [Agromyces sp. LHK192]
MTHPYAPHPQHNPGPNPTPSPWVARTPKPRSGGLVFGIIGLVVGGVVGLLVLAYLIAGLGVPTFAVGTLLALLPLTVVLLAIRWVDRWEPEPRWALWFALIWGAAVSVAIALIVDLGVQLAAAYSMPGGTPDLWAQTVVQAPLVEETAKGLGVLLVFLFSRTHFDGPVDGLVYGATVAAGFAFTENILYFGGALAEGGAEQLGATFVVRAIFSPFAHVLFTACTGLALGIAARRGGGAAVIGWFLLGLACAVALHALWNGSLGFGADAIGLYVTVQVPLFAGAIVATVLLRRREVAITRARLAEYAAAGWFAPAEVDMLASPAGRRAAIRWAEQRRPARTATMRRLISDATHLAFDRQAVLTGRGDVRRVHDEGALLTRITADRAALMSG